MQFLALTFSQRRLLGLGAIALVTAVLSGVGLGLLGPVLGTAVAVFLIMSGLGALVVGFAVRTGFQIAQLEARASLDAAIAEPRLWLHVSSYSARPDFLLEVHKAVHQRRPRLVVELGSGLSTLVVARTLVLEGIGGRILSIDHDKDYLGAVEERLRELDLLEPVTLVHAPLARLQDGRLWYATDCLGEDLRAVDFVIVDGPPRRFGRDIREPALDLLVPHLAPGAWIYLDDAYRPDERRILRKWARRYPGAVVRRLPAERGIGVVEWRGTNGIGP